MHFNNLDDVAKYVQEHIKKKLKELINVLLNNANMSKRDLEKRFNISSWKVEQILKL